MALRQFIPEVLTNNAHLSSSSKITHARSRLPSNKQRHTYTGPKRRKQSTIALHHQRKKRHAKHHRKHLHSPTQLTTHHRLPKRYGGHATSENISMVTWMHHDAWNVLFDRKSEAYSLTSYVGVIAERLASYINAYMVGFDSCQWFIDRKSKESWEVLFGGLTLNQIMRTINSVWLPTTFRLEIVGRVKVQVHEVK